MNKDDLELLDNTARDYLSKTMLSTYWSFHKLEEDGEVEYVAIVTMIFKDGSRASEIVQTLNKKEYFLYKIGSKTFDPYEKYRNGS